jgi:hypothetical protein
MKISVIGAGVMGEALIAALIKAGHSPDSIEIIEKRAERAEELKAKYSIKVGEDLSNCDVLLLVTKPQDIKWQSESGCFGSFICCRKENRNYCQRFKWQESCNTSNAKYANASR